MHRPAFQGLAVVRSTLPQNFCLRSGPYAFVWQEASFQHFEATELHNRAPEWPESLNTTMGRCTGPVDPFPAVVGLKGVSNERKLCPE